MRPGSKRRAPRSMSDEQSSIEVAASKLMLTGDHRLRRGARQVLGALRAFDYGSDQRGKASERGASHAATETPLAFPADTATRVHPRGRVGGEGGGVGAAESQGGGKDSLLVGPPHAHHYGGKFASLGTMAVQRSHAQLWASLRQCQNLWDLRGVGLDVR